MANIKAGFLQTAPVFGDLEGNVGRVVKRLGRADTEGLELVVLLKKNCARSPKTSRTAIASAGSVFSPKTAACT